MALEKASAGQSRQLQMVSEEEEELPPAPDPRTPGQRKGRSSGSQSDYSRGESLTLLEGLHWRAGYLSRRTEGGVVGNNVLVFQMFCLVVVFPVSL